jgi:hypothetical protein
VRSTSLPEWGPKECDARKALNCVRLELEPSVAQDLIGSVLAAFAELQADRDRERGLRLKAEFWQRHSPWKPACGPTVDGIMHPCPDPGHDRTDEQWIDYGRVEAGNEKP